MEENAMSSLPSAVEDLFQPLGISDSFGGTLTLNGKDPVLASCHKLGEATASILGARAAAAALWKERTRQDTDIDIRLVDAIHALHATNFIWLNGLQGRHRSHRHSRDRPLQMQGWQVDLLHCRAAVSEAAKRIHELL
jgi:hypothetical protein